MTQPFSQPGQPQPLLPPPPPPKKSSPWTSKPLMAVYGGIIGLAIGAALFATQGTPTATPAPTATVTVTAPGPDVTEGANTPSDAPTSDAPANYRPSKSDWTVQTKVTSKECFGSAGCNVTVGIHPQYVGSADLPTTGTIEVTYELTGTQDPLVDTFTVTNGDEVSYTKSQNVQTKTSGAKIGAKVTSVDYSG